MKKALCLFAALCIILSLAACGGGKKPAEQPLDGPGMINPWMETGREAIENITGMRFGLPDGAENVVWRYNQSIEMAELLFTLDDTKWTARAQKTDAFEDISGMYYPWDPDNCGYSDDIRIETGNCCLPGTLRLLRTDEGTVNLGLWYYQEAGYSLSLAAIAKQGVVYMPASEVFLLDGSGAGREVYPPECPPFDLENRAELFRALVEEYDGFEIVYRLGESMTVRCGGQGDVCWYIAYGAPGTEAAIADFSVSGTEAIYNWTPSDPEEESQTVVIEPEKVLDFITQRVYTYRPEFDPADHTPAELILQGFPCLRYNFYGGLVALDISTDYGVTLRYTYSRDGINDLAVTEINTGIEVIPPV